MTAPTRDEQARRYRASLCVDCHRGHITAVPEPRPEVAG